MSFVFSRCEHLRTNNLPARFRVKERRLDTMPSFSDRGLGSTFFVCGTFKVYDLCVWTFKNTKQQQT